MTKDKMENKQKEEAQVSKGANRQKERQSQTQRFHDTPVHQYYLQRFFFIVLGVGMIHDQGRSGDE